MYTLLRIALLDALLLQTGAGTLGPPRDVVFIARVDGTEQHYVEMLPPGFDLAVEHHVLIALHGHGSDRHQYATASRDECRSVRDVAAKRGLIFISPDYRASTSWMGPKAEADMVQIIEELRGRHRVGKVFLVGASMGGSSALTFAALHPDLIAGVCSSNGTANHLEYENFQDAIGGSFGGSKRQIPLEYKKRSAEYFPEAFTMPVAITAGGHDTLVPPHSVVRLAHILEKLGRKVFLIYREEGAHNTDYTDTTVALEYMLRTSLEPEIGPH
jgi:predicted esterase